MDEVISVTTALQYPTQAKGMLMGTKWATHVTMISTTMVL
ncbi:Hypothetical protein TART1_2241 [Trichococcus shcherbakoviae]|uniref:Uncharacterized protein n=1 Tax=Trichococcus shcherbakoviae TaxID=2094020 RepID=A0A383THB3_9LACT|nr:Hypothetical protein TART1_2241 [Trichococcus shcherbakoviae]